VYPVLEHL
jgi:hypothetical protein